MTKRKNKPKKGKRRGKFGLKKNRNNVCSVDGFKKIKTKQIPNPSSRMPQLKKLKHYIGPKIKGVCKDIRKPTCLQAKNFYTG